VFIANFFHQQQFGPLRVVGYAKQRGRCIAVAGRRGLCVYDAGLGAGGKWRRFGNVEEERSIEVVNLCWFEVSSPDVRVSDEDVCIGVVKLGSSNKMCLRGWSRRRIAMGEDELIEPLTSGDDEIPAELKNANIVDLLPEPYQQHRRSANNSSINGDDDDEDDTNNNSDGLPGDRALMIVADTETSPDVIRFAIYELQKVTELNKNKRRRTKIIVKRVLNSTLRQCQYVSGMFLAGGSFDHFNLEGERNMIEGLKAQNIAYVCERAKRAGCKNENEERSDEYCCFAEEPTRS